MLGPGRLISTRLTAFGTQTGPLLSNQKERTNRLKGMPPSGWSVSTDRLWNTVVSPRLCQEGNVPAPKLVASTKVKQNESCEDGETTRDCLPC